MTPSPDLNTTTTRPIMAKHPHNLLPLQDKTQLQPQIPPKPSLSLLPHSPPPKQPVLPTLPVVPTQSPTYPTYPTYPSQTPLATNNKTCIPCSIHLLYPRQEINLPGVNRCNQCTTTPRRKRAGYLHCHHTDVVSPPAKLGSFICHGQGNQSRD